MVLIKPLISALPLIPRGDGMALCRRFCRVLQGGTVSGHAGRVPTHLAMKDGPYLCLCMCTGFALQSPIRISRPRSRGRALATSRARETASGAMVK